MSLYSNIVCLCVGYVWPNYPRHGYTGDAMLDDYKFLDTCRVSKRISEKSVNTALWNSWHNCSATLWWCLGSCAGFECNNVHDKLQWFWRIWLWKLFRRVCATWRFYVQQHKNGMSHHLEPEANKLLRCIGMTEISSGYILIVTVTKHADLLGCKLKSHLWYQG